MPSYPFHSRALILGVSLPPSQAASQGTTEMKDKLKVLQNELDILQNEVRCVCRVSGREKDWVWSCRHASACQWSALHKVCHEPETKQDDWALVDGACETGVHPRGARLDPVCRTIDSS